MIYTTTKTLTTLFLLFAFVCFSRIVYQKRNSSTAPIMGDVVSAIFMLSAIYFIWN